METAVDKFSRPEVQRTELGPLIHIVAHDIYDGIDDCIANDWHDDLTHIAGMPTGNLKLVDSLLSYEALIAERSREVVREVCDGNYLYSEIDEYITSRFSSSHGVQGIGNKLTTIPNLMMLVGEGVRSGLVLPMMLWKSIARAEKNRRLAHSYHVSSDSLLGIVDLHEVIDRLSSQIFADMLALTAYGRNGSLGPLSADPSSITRDVSIPNFKHVNFQYNEEGKVIGFCPEFVAESVKKLVDHNKDARGMGFKLESGGCPVRHQVFKKIGEPADEIIKVLPPEKRKYLETGESSIQRGVKTLVRSIELLANTA